MDQGQLLAIGDVVLEAHPEAAGHLRNFYGQLLGLPEASDQQQPHEIRFQSQRLYLRICLHPDARPNPVARRATIRVPSLDQLRRRLEQRNLPYELYRGLSFTEQRIFVADPAGWRIECKQSWPF